MWFWYGSKQKRCRHFFMFSWSFFHVKNRSTVMTSKHLPNNLSNENKHWYFWFLQDKNELKLKLMFSLLRFFDEFFWRDNCWSIFDVVKASAFDTFSTRLTVFWWQILKKKLTPPPFQLPTSFMDSPYLQISLKPW